MSCNRPIGIFDSGIGGLTVARAINKALPNEQLIYFGDTAHFPYGDKERKSIQKYCDRISDFLIDKNCKAIVIACNTASSASSKILSKKFSGIVPVFDVITPVVEYIEQNHAIDKIGIIATKGTINSRVYPKLITDKIPSAKVSSCATPLLAPMIEEGFFSNNISKSIIASYLSKNNIQSIDCLVLGCTHYPIIEKEIIAFYKNKKKRVNIINSAKIVAEKISKELETLDLLSNNKNYEHEFYISDYTSSFEKSSEIFFEETVKLKKIQLWK